MPPDELTPDPYKITFETWNKVADLYQDKFMHLDLYNDTYDRFCELVEKPGASIFEIGCGPGNITRYLLGRRPDLHIEGTDVAPAMVKLASENNPAASFRVMDARELGQVRSKYNGLMCGFCLPYLAQADVVELVKNAAALLYPGGILYLSTIEGQYADSGYEAGSSGHRSYVYYYPESYLRQLLADRHFELIDLVRKAYPKTPDGISTHLIFIVRKISALSES